ncbi:DUF4376 domain-containing protein [Pasteurella multocida subsp. multocida]|uniref:DUF4376 domain-containing protein n=1 Tax=Pasteurella multocida TaxID=747 RepID=A0A9X3UVC2_PASMD|nr:DUF4376 domain-containing protein [Pasteurella multocida]MDA5611537.1 DUF4376 domain-containing protein [Pasteurella multocida]MDA5614035.1 DUF4376 domain-containing protein [Pasteurella multocida]MDA5619005.1 DUF4376 domain-containing protein [Pasteurella multocida subsp. multocida]MDA5621754.1 DUF4376 domain-containing protein [Pasteurella multocida subsp. multocida]MDA5623966.1 DUF4376 domain-containing protein [Pasteurella multocida]
MYFFDEKTNGFYIEGLHVITEDMTLISEQHYKQLIEGQSQGKQIVVNKHGKPILADSQPTQYHEWDGEKWAISAEKQAEIKLLQQEKMREKINALRDEKINGGVYVPELGKWFDSDARAESSLNSVKSTFDLLGDMEITWICADNTPVQINKEKLILVWKAIMQAQQQNHANALHHKAEMMKAENPLNYDYSAGWTEVYGS